MVSGFVQEGSSGNQPIYGLNSHLSALDLISSEVLMEVSRSVPEMVREFLLISNRKSSRMGNTVLVLITPFTICDCGAGSSTDNEFHASVLRPFDSVKGKYKQTSAGA